MKEQKFERVVEYENDCLLESIGLFLFVTFLYLVGLAYTFDIGFNFFSIIIFMSAGIAYSFFIYLTYAGLKSKKVYWRKIKWVMKNGNINTQMF